MFKKMIRRAVVLTVMTALLLMMLPAPTYADGDTLWVLLGLAFITVLILNADDNLFKDMYIDTYSPETGTLMELGDGMYSYNDIYYDLDWLFARKTEGKLWGAAGLTMKFTPSYSNYFNDQAVGGNFLLGYNNDEWDWLARYVTFKDGGSLAKFEATCRF